MAEFSNGTEVEEHNDANQTSSQPSDSLEGNHATSAGQRHNEPAEITLDLRQLLPTGNVSNVRKDGVPA
jgi:hypothetical protein